MLWKKIHLLCNNFPLSRPFEEPLKWISDSENVRVGKFLVSFINTHQQESQNLILPSAACSWVNKGTTLL